MSKETFSRNLCPGVSLSKAPIIGWRSNPRIQEAIAMAKVAQERRARGESTLTSADEMRRLMQEKQAKYEG